MVLNIRGSYKIEPWIALVTRLLSLGFYPRSIIPTARMELR